MKVIDVSSFRGEYVYTDVPVWDEYIRYGPDNWRVCMGESTETVSSYESDGLEEAYQEYMRNRNAQG